MTSLPTAGQLAWQDLGIGVFVHVGVNTFADLEWSDGTVPASAFDPADLDAGEWLDVAVEMGARYAVLTAKHHDGFCLWPTETTDYSVRSSPWRGGAGDVVAEFVRACRERDVAVGLYLSPWDRHDPSYADPPAYSELYARQLTELCTRYGPLAELWFDGAGSDGYTYDWGRIMAVVHAHQPDAQVFNMGEPTIRWIGNEDGLSHDLTPYVVDTTPGNQYTDTVNALGTARYLPPEADVSIRTGWFWHPAEEPKPVDHLLAIAYRSVGLGANLLLNVPPTSAGRIDPRDAARLRAWSAEWRRRMDALAPAEIVAEEQRPTFARWRVPVDGPVDHLAIREDLRAGQQIFVHRVLTPDGTVLATGGTIGSLRLHAFPPTEVSHLVLETDGGRLRSAAAGLTGVSRIEDLPPAGRPSQGN